MLEEIGVPYESIPVRDTRDLSYLALNPNGRVPTLVDGDVVVWESLAINLYLARRYQSDLSPLSLGEEAQALQWSFWAESEMEAVLNQIPSLGEVPVEWRSRVLGVLDGALQSSGHLIGVRFSVADLNVVNMFNGPVSSRLDLSPYAHLNSWLARCRARPAARRVLEHISRALEMADAVDPG
jgi:glutathione S-transferase